MNPASSLTRWALLVVYGNETLRNIIRIAAQGHSSSSPDRQSALGSLEAICGCIVNDVYVANRSTLDGSNMLRKLQMESKMGVTAALSRACRLMPRCVIASVGMG